MLIEDEAGRIYLMDFGIAKRAGARRADAGRRLRRHASTTRRPSRSRRRRSAPPADIYAFGCVLYEALTGKKPFERETDVAVMHAHMHEPPPAVSEVRPELPEALDAVIARAMAKAHDERFATCREMIEAARAALGGQAVASPPRPAPTVADARPRRSSREPARRSRRR